MEHNYHKVVTEGYKTVEDAVEEYLREMYDPKNIVKSGLGVRPLPRIDTSMDIVVSEFLKEKNVPHGRAHDILKLTLLQYSFGYCKGRLKEHGLDYVVSSAIKPGVEYFTKSIAKSAAKKIDEFEPEEMIDIAVKTGVETFVKIFSPEENKDSK